MSDEEVGGRNRRRGIKEGKWHSGTGQKHGSTEWCHLGTYYSSWILCPIPSSLHFSLLFMLLLVPRGILTYQFLLLNIPPSHHFSTLSISAL